jgi:hypothetical protein
MTNFQNWKDYMMHLLTANKQFILFDTTYKGETTSEFYKQQIGDKETVIKVGYLKNGRLITLDVTNPNTPGHNAEQIEYFYENDFDETKSYGSVGLTFSDTNKNAISKVLKSGLQGTEKKYFKDNKLEFSKVFKPTGNNNELLGQTHYFTNKNLWLRLLKKLTTAKQEYKVEEIELDKVFTGLK